MNNDYFNNFNKYDIYSKYANSSYTNSQVDKNWSITPRSTDVKTFAYKYETDIQIQDQNNEVLVNNLKLAAAQELLKIIKDDMVVIKRRNIEEFKDIYEVRYNLINQQTRQNTTVIDMYEYEINGKKFTHEQISEGMKRAFPEHWL